MKNDKLTMSQESVLIEASETAILDPATLSLKGGARNKILGALVNKGFLTKQGEGYAITNDGRAAIGIKEAPKASAKPTKATASGKSRIRTGTKLHSVIEMLSRPEGAEIHEIMRDTGWQQHTVRGTFTGALKKRLGLTIETEKQEGRDRIYRITGGLDKLEILA